MVELRKLNTALALVFVLVATIGLALLSMTLGSIKLGTAAPLGPMSLISLSVCLSIGVAYFSFSPVKSLLGSVQPARQALVTCLLSLSLISILVVFLIGNI